MLYEITSFFPFSLLVSTLRAYLDLTPSQTRHRNMTRVALTRSQTYVNWANYVGDNRARPNGMTCKVSSAPYVSLRTKQGGAALIDRLTLRIWNQLVLINMYNCI